MTDVMGKAVRCQNLLDDKDLQEAFANVREALFQQFSKTSTTDAETMLDIRKRLHLLDSVESNLYQAIQDGHLEKFRIDEQERPPFLGDISAWMRKKQKRA